MIILAPLLQQETLSVQVCPKIHSTSFEDAIVGIVYYSKLKISHVVLNNHVHSKLAMKAMEDELRGVSHVVGISPGLILGVFALGAVLVSPIFKLF